MEMILSSGLILLVFFAVFSIIYAWKILNWVWFRPKKLEKSLRQQGLKGNSYRFFVGDLEEMSQMMREAKSKPINFSNDIVQRVNPFIHKGVKENGQSFFQWIGPKPSVIILDHEVVKEVLSKNYTFIKPPNPLGRLLARGVASYETDKWVKHRKLINPAFHIEKLKHMLPSFYSSCCDMLSQWEKIVPSEGSFELDIWPYLQTLTSDAISRTAFGSSYEEGRKIFELQKEQAELIIKGSRSVYIPGWSFLPTKINRRMKVIVKEVESSILRIIEKRMNAIESGETGDDLLGILLESNIKEIKQHGDKSGMSLQEVIEECKLFYFAGQETTSAMLVWTMILLSRHQEWQTRAREEVIKAFGKEKSDFQELNHLKIVTMIFHEVLRLYPPGIALGRTTQKETRVGNLTLPAGVQLLLPILLLQHQTELWGDDANEFKPERFSEGVSKAAGAGQLAYFPFGWGPRLCLGQNFAMLEAKMALAMMLQNYSFELSPSYTHAPHTVITLQPQHGAQLILRKLL